MVRSIQGGIRPYRDNAARIEGKKIAVIVSLDRLKVTGRRYSRHLVEISEIGSEGWIVLNAAGITFK